MISIIIITLNEEKYLPKLLESIKKQSFTDYEVIVSDAGSKDKTLQIAKEFGCKIVKGGLPPVGRNNGAIIAKGDLLFFLDSDIQLRRDFLKKSINELRRKNLDVAGVYMNPMSKNVIDKFYYGFLNFWFFVMQKIFPHVVGSCMISTKRVYKSINGFNPKLKFTDDLDYVNRASKYFKFGMVGTSVFVSARRFKKEGRFKMGIKYLLVFFYRILLGEVKTDVFNYRFDHY